MAETTTTVPTAGLVAGGVLVVLGIGSYTLSGFASVTALIPAFFGLLIALLAVAGRRRDRPRLASYGIAALALVGIAGSARGLPDVLALLTGGTVDSTVAAVSQGGMILVCLLLLVVVGSALLGDR
ncbi:hypothetical protein [Natronorarus salvus]|uniref:hypothetical protein n=1 Tax=Natronorarus salvus TaxID=3117733 RepID=UPI002F26C492